MYPTSEWSGSLLGAIMDRRAPPIWLETMPRPAETPIAYFSTTWTWPSAASSTMGDRAA